MLSGSCQKELLSSHHLYDDLPSVAMSVCERKRGGMRERGREREMDKQGCVAAYIHSASSTFELQIMHFR